MFDEVNSIYLDHIYLGSKFNLLHFLASYNWPYVSLINTNNPIAYALSCFKHLLLPEQELS